MVRQQVESVGVLVEMRQLSPTFSLLEALDSAAKRGFLYTIIITSQHESHRSVTLTILHGRNPQGLYKKTFSNSISQTCVVVVVVFLFLHSHVPVKHQPP